ncbi:MAG: WD40 repeat domain-containing protein [Spirochaetia bacterium]|nr:WD40 repeat domain-containing protein [Spirochaetia bacterium]
MGLLKRVMIGIAITAISMGLLFSCASYKYPDDFGFTSKAVMSGHTDQVLDMDLSPDGKYLASASMDDTVRIWDTHTLEELGVLEGHADDVYSVSFGPGARHVVTGARDGAVRVYALPSGEQVHLLRGHAEAVYSVSYSPDGKQILSGGKDTTVRVWDADSGELLKVFRGHSGEINSVLVGPDSKIGYSTAIDGTLRSWYLQEDLAPGFIEKVNKQSIINVALSPNGEKIAFTGMEKVYDEAAKQWRKIYPLYIANFGSNGLENVQRRRGHDRVAWGLAWAPDGRSIVTGGSDKRLFFWDVEDKYRREKVLPNSGNIWDVEITPNGQRVFAATSKNDIVVYTK